MSLHLYGTWYSIFSLHAWFKSNRPGRRGYRLVDILAVRAVMLFFKQGNIRMTMEFLKGNPNIRRIIGLSRIPSRSVISRKSKELLRVLDIESLHRTIASEFYSSCLVCNLSIDSTPIDAMGKPVKKRKLVKRLGEAGREKVQIRNVNMQREQRRRKDCRSLQ